MTNGGWAGLVVAGAGWTKSLHGLIADVLPEL